MFETEIKKPKIMLVSVDIGEYDAEQSIAELAELVDTAGGETVIKIIQKQC